MNINPPQNFVEFFRSSFVYFVLVASLAASFAVLVTRPIQKFEQYAIEVEIREFVKSEPVPVKMKEFEFSFCCSGGCGPDLLDLADGIGDVVMTLLFLLPALAVLTFVSVLFSFAPGLDPAHYQTAASISFIFYTAYYWLSVGYLIYNPPGGTGSWRDELKVISILDDSGD